MAGLGLMVVSLCFLGESRSNDDMIDKVLQNLFVWTAIIIYGIDVVYQIIEIWRRT